MNNNGQKHERRFPVRLTEAQQGRRRGSLPKFSERLRLDEPNERMSRSRWMN